ncbi:MAG: hypothetical protein JL50_14520 [Peptococcaceae bacterium BICA1-7]|nr:MAG: hypothetical protein JL50_14520 [Peptococcaceae bacterium BICA1-7]HBV98254.1 DUF1573 domain-containing protein [Desulfotomaculum sp.]
MLKDIVFDEFQNTVSDFLICNRSILDIMGKVQETNARLHQSIIKSVTRCGCIKIDASRQAIPSEATLADLKLLLDSHIKGTLCDKCQENIENSIGKLILYTAAVCNLLDMNMYDIILKEQKQLKILGYYNLA